MTTLDEPLGSEQRYDLTWRQFGPRDAARKASFHLYRSGDWCVVQVSGEVDIQVTPMMEAVLVRARSSDLVLDLSKVSFMDASGLAVLANAWQRADAVGGRVRLVAPCDRVRKVLTLTRLDTILPIFDSLDEAIC